MIQFKKITTNKSVLLFLIFLTTTTHCFLQNDHRETSRRSNDRENRNFPERRQVGKDLNIRNMFYKFDEKDRMYENLYDRRSFRTGTPAKSESTERRVLGFSSNNNRREVRSTFAESNDNKASVINRQRFSIDQNKNAENSRNRNANDRRYMNRIDLNRVTRRYVSGNERIATRRDFENRRQISVDRKINPSVGEQIRAFSSRSDSTRQIQNARIHFEREDKRDTRTQDARDIVSSRNNRQMNEISRASDSAVHLRENARILDRRENINSRNLIIQTPQHRQERNKLSRSDMSRRTPEIDQTRNTFASRLPQENRRDLTRNRLARVSNSNSFIRNVPTLKYTGSEFFMNSRNRNEHRRENISRKSSRQNLRETSTTQVRRVIPVKHSSQTDDARFGKSANVPQLKISNSYAVRDLPENDVSPVSAELREKSIGLHSSQESYDYLKQNMGFNNSWANAAQVILGIYLIGQIFLNSSIKNKPRFHIFAVGSMKDKMH